MAELNKIKIQKIKVAGQPIYPATILDAVKDATAKITVNGSEVDNPSYGKTLREIIVDNEKVTAASLNDLNTKVGDLASLETTDKTDLVAAINSVKAAAAGDVGDITELETEAKDSAVDAINELKTRLDNAVGTPVEGDTNTQSIGAVSGRVKAIEDSIGAAADGTIDTLGEVLTWFNEVSAADGTYKVTLGDGDDAAEVELGKGQAGLLSTVAENKFAIGTAGTPASGNEGEEGYVAAVPGTGLTGRIEALEALTGTDSVEDQIADAIDALAGEATGSDNTAAEGEASNAKVTVTVASENGEVSSVTVTTNDIASAALVGTLPTGDDAPEATTVVGYAEELVAAEEAARKAQIGELGKVSEEEGAADHTVKSYVDAQVAAGFSAVDLTDAEEAAVEYDDVF